VLSNLLRLLLLPLLLLLLLLLCQDFVRHSGAMLPGLAGTPRDQAFTNMLWALGCWEHQPPAAWLQEYCR
jgi:hypothetical protein